MAMKQHLDLVDDPLCVYPACTSQVLCHCGSGTSRQHTQGAVVLVKLQIATKQDKHTTQCCVEQQP